MKLHVVNFGCKLNLSESHDLQRKAQQLGFIITKNIQNTEVIIINSCHVTNQALQKIIRFVNKIPPQVKHIVVTGCLPINTGFDRGDIYIDYQHDHDKIILFLSSIITKKIAPDTIRKTSTREFVKIQSGCDTCCTYCIIPHYRGRPTGIPLPAIIDKISTLEQENYREIILTGTNLGKYKYLQTDLAGLIDKIISHTKIERLRISSIDVTDLDQKLLDLYRTHSDRICPHFHLALQSGSDRVLKLMHRPYTSEQFLSWTEKIYQTVPDATITTDIIVGFPSETDADFIDTLRMIKKCRFLKTHIFSYSEHPQTPSVKILPKINPDIARERHKLAVQYASRVRRQVMHSFIGKKFPVLFEQKKNGYHSGFTPNYLPVKTIANPGQDLTNKIVNINLKRYRQGYFHF